MIRALKRKREKGRIESGCFLVAQVPGNIRDHAFAIGCRSAHRDDIDGANEFGECDPLSKTREESGGAGEGQCDIRRTNV